MSLFSFVLLSLSTLLVNVHGTLLPCGKAFYDPTKVDNLPSVETVIIVKQHSTHVILETSYVQ